jgi:hypothetical protein
MATILAPGIDAPLLSVIFPLNEDVVAPCPNTITVINRKTNTEKIRLNWYIINIGLRIKKISTRLSYIIDYLITPELQYC